MANTKKYVSLDKLSLYDEKIKKVITDADAAGLQAAKDYADSLATNYDAAGAAAGVQGKLDAEVLRAQGEEARIEGLVSTAQGEVDALELVVATKAAQADLEALSGKVGAVPEGSTVMGIITNIQESAYDDTAIRGLISGLDTNKADKAQVATDIENAVKAEKEAREAAVSGVQGAVDALSGTHATDKKALEDAIALKADITALNAVSDVANAAVKQADYDVKVKALGDEDARIVGLVEAEAAKAREEEGKLDARLVEVETFFKTTEDETLDTALDTLVELQKYLEGEGAIADQMLLDIAANKKSIEDHVATDHDFAGADAALKSELEGKINGKVAQGDFDAVEGRVDTLEGEMDAVEGRLDAVEPKVNTLEGQMTAVQAAVATKVEQEAYNVKVAALEGEDTAIKGRLDALEAKHGDGEGTVESMIDAAKSELLTAIEGAKTDASNKDAVVLAEAQKGIDAVQLALDTHTGNGDVHVTTTDKAKWNAALQASDIVTGAANGTIAVKGNDVAVKGLGTAAYKAETAFDAAGSAAQALTDAKAHTDALFAQFVEVSEEEINALFQ